MVLPLVTLLACRVIAAACRAGSASEGAGRARRPHASTRGRRSAARSTITYKLRRRAERRVRRRLPRHGPRRRRRRGADVDRRSQSADANERVEARPDGRVHAHRVHPGLPVRRGAPRPGRPVLGRPTAKRLPLAGEDAGQRAYKVGEIRAAAADREPVHHLQGRLASGRSGRAQATASNGSGRRRKRRCRPRIPGRMPCSTSMSTVSPMSELTGPSRCRFASATSRGSVHVQARGRSIAEE